MRGFLITSLSFCCLLASILANCSSTPEQPVSPKWIQWTSASVVYDTTIDKKDHTLIYFHATWCGWCKKLETLTLANPQIIATINSSFNAVLIDVDADSTVTCQNGAVPCSEFTRTIYHVTGYPTVVACDWQGNEIGRCVGYRDVAGFSQWLAQLRSPL